MAIPESHGIALVMIKFATPMPIVLSNKTVFHKSMVDKKIVEKTSCLNSGKKVIVSHEAGFHVLADTLIARWHYDFPPFISEFVLAS